MKNKKKRSTRPQIVQFSGPKSSEEAKKRSSRPQIVRYTIYISPLHHKIFVHLSADGGGRDPELNVICVVFKYVIVAGSK